jgi:hypothetical protein
MATTIMPVGHDAPKYLLRMPPELNERVRRLAEDQDMPSNSKILMLLAGSVGFEFTEEGEGK